MFAVRAPQSKPAMLSAMRRSATPITIPTRRVPSFHWTMVLIGTRVVSDTLDALHCGEGGRTHIGVYVREVRKGRQQR